MENKYTITIKSQRPANTVNNHTAYAIYSYLRGEGLALPVTVKDDHRLEVKTNRKSDIAAVKRSILKVFETPVTIACIDTDGKVHEVWNAQKCLRFYDNRMAWEKCAATDECVYAADILEDKNRKNEPVHVYESFADETGKEVTLGELGDMICDDSILLKTDNCRRLLKRGATDKFARMKRSLPNVVIGAVMDGKRCMANVLRPTGYIMIDIDHIDSDNSVYRISNALMGLPYGCLMWESVSGLGLHVVCKWRGWSDDGFIAEYSECYRRLSGEISALLSNKGFDSSSYEIDPACKDISRCCFISSPYMHLHYKPECWCYIYRQSPLEGTDTAEGGAKGINRPKTENVAPVASGGDDEDIEVYDVEVVSAAPITGVEPGDIDALEQAEKSLHDDFMRDLKDIFAKAKEKYDNEMANAAELDALCG